MKTGDCIRDIQEVKDYEKKLEAIEMKNIILKKLKEKQEELEEVEKDYKLFLNSDFRRLEIGFDYYRFGCSKKKWSCGKIKGESYWTR